MASKRTNDLHLRLTDEERRMGEEYAKYLKSAAGVACSWTEAFRALAVKGHTAYRSEVGKRKVS